MMVVPRFGLPIGFLLCAVLLVFVPGLAWAQARSLTPPDGGFSRPLDCSLDRDCWIINLPDTGPGPEAVDYRCGARTYDGHGGTDFAVRDFRALDEEVPVLASASGSVVAIRNDAPEHFVYNEETRQRIGREMCGNGVIIDHGDGWQSQYCHMRTGSVSVSPGVVVRRGQPLGLAGMSGKTEFPHVHVAFRMNDKTFDPFTGREVQTGCGQNGRSLWHPDAGIGYPGPALYAAGFTGHTPEMAEILSSARSPVYLTRHAPALVLWAAMFGVEDGDLLRLRIVDPDGETMVEREVEIEKTQARRMEFFGRKIHSAGWSVGKWRGEAALERDVDGRKLIRRIVVPLEIR